MQKNEDFGYHIGLAILRIATYQHDVTHILRNKKKQYVIYIFIKNA